MHHLSATAAAAVAVLQVRQPAVSQSPRGRSDGKKAAFDSLDGNIAISAESAAPVCIVMVDSGGRIIAARVVPMRKDRQREWASPFRLQKPELDSDVRFGFDPSLLTGVLAQVIDLHEFDPDFMMTDLFGYLVKADQPVKDRACLLLPRIEPARVVGTESMFVLSFAEKTLEIVPDFFRIVSEIVPVLGVRARREQADQDSCVDYLAERTESLSVEKHGTPHYHL
jgi:hypothetical protein